MSIDALLQPLEKFGVDLGLDRILHLLERLDNPQNQVPIIHIAGTNGKGSVCAYLTSVLKQAGYRVGCYTSPHLVSWCERISINQTWITPEALEQALIAVEQAIDPTVPPPTQFERITAAAWLYFAQQQVEIAVIEVGLGGRLDATNVCDHPLVTVITSISREHWQVLGDTLGAIAGEKAGILKPNCPAVMGVLPPEAQAVVHARSEAVGCPLSEVEPAMPIPALELDVLGLGELAKIPRIQWLETQGIQYPIALQGEFQRANSALAIAAIQNLRDQGWQISDYALQLGMGLAQWPGRLQFFTWRGHTLLIDGAHNPAAAAGLRQFVDQVYRDQSITWVMGMLSTKDHREVFSALLKPGDRLFLVPVPDHSTAEPDVLAALARSLCPLQRCETFPDLEAALCRAIAPQQTPGSPVVFCGSLYLIGHFFGTLAHDSGN